MKAIAIDFGGTKIEASIVSDKGKILKTIKHPTEHKKGKALIIKNLLYCIGELGTKGIAGIGISMPGMIKKGKVIWGGGTLRNLDNVDIGGIIAKKTSLPVWVENDANCFALAEATFGAGRDYSVVLGVIWGTGIGSGIVMNRHIYAGSKGGAGEFGHNIVDHTKKDGPVCIGCGLRGCLESLASGKNIERIYKSRGGKIKDAKVPQIYKSKEKVAKDTINDAIYFLGLGLSHLVNTLDPEILVLGGGVSLLPSPVYKKLNQIVKHFSIPEIFKGTKIVRHKISASSGIIGAAAMVFENS